MIAIFQNISWNIYDNNNPLKSAHVISIYKMAFGLDFKSSIDSIEIEVRFMEYFTSIFEYHCNIAAMNSFDILDNFNTDINETILINIE